MKENVVKNKSLEFALRIVNLFQYLSDKKKEYVLSKQLLRSGTAIGTLVRESEYAESKDDFIHKHSIALKQSNGSDYWIKLLYRFGYLAESEYLTLFSDLDEIIRLLVPIIKTSKANR